MINIILVLAAVIILYLLIGKFLRALHKDLKSIRDRLNRIEDALAKKGIKINREKNWIPSLNYFVDRSEEGIEE